MTQAATVEFFLKKSTGDKWNVTVKVKEFDEPRDPIGGATVTFESMGSGQTGNTGMIMFPDVPEGTYQVSAEKEGYIRETKAVPIPPN